MERRQNLPDVGNRCDRCNRSLNDPTARYGWRCAQILGIDQTLNRVDDRVWNAAISGIDHARRNLSHPAIAMAPINHSAYYDAAIRYYLALGKNDRSSAPAAQNLDRVNNSPLRYVLNTHNDVSAQYISAIIKSINELRNTCPSMYPDYDFERMKQSQIEYMESIIRLQLDRSARESLLRFLIQ
jgi:hypothetical protein